MFGEKKRARKDDIYKKQNYKASEYNLLTGNLLLAALWALY